MRDIIFFWKCGNIGMRNEEGERIVYRQKRRIKEEKRKQQYRCMCCCNALNTRHINR